MRVVGNGDDNAFEFPAIGKDFFDGLVVRPGPAAAIADAQDFTTLRIDSQPARRAVEPDVDILNGPRVLSDLYRPVAVGHRREIRPVRALRTASTLL